MTHIWSRLGLTFTFVDGGDTRAVAAAVTPNTKIVYRRDADQSDDATVRSQGDRRDRTHAKALFVVDNTFATPYFQQPLQFGADIVLHSTTKYLNGHSDMVGGMLVRDPRTISRTASGSSELVLAPCRGRSTAGWRSAAPRHWRCGWPGTTRTAGASPEFLEKHPRVQRVYYPGLRSHPQHELAGRQMRGYGGMLSIELGDTAFARRFVERTTDLRAGRIVGGVGELDRTPGVDDACQRAAEMRRRMGLTDSLVRLSVGIEDVET